MISHPIARRLLELLFAAGLLLGARNAAATDYYVATTGDDSNAGTSIDQPFASLQRAHSAVMAGDTVYIRGGTYAIVTPATSSAGVSITKSGTSDTNRIKFWAYNGEVPVFDFAMLQISTNGYTNGFTVSGSFLHFKGLEIKNVPMNTNSNNGMSSSGSNNVFELINFHHNNGTGLFINGGMGGNLILNCDSHDNYDPTSSQGDGQNADGFGVHYQMSGASTVISGCRAWWDSDDGYDLINHEVPVTIENSWAMGNGYINSGAARPADGNGNGFKAGSSKTGARHIIRNCLAWGNVASGFYANHSLGGNTWYNNTSYRNGTQYNMLATDPTDSTGVKVTLMGDKVHIMRNNIGYPNKNSNMEGVDTAQNSWDLGITPADSDFVSVSDMGFKMAPRQADGSLPNLDFMKLSATGNMIDKGEDVGLPYAGTAPDLGCFETGLPSGGTGGSGESGAGAGGTGNGGAETAGGGVGGATAGAPATGGSNMGGAFTGGAGSNAGATGAGTGGAGGSGGANAGTGGSVVASGGTSTGTAGASGATASADSASDQAGCGCELVGRRSSSFGAALAALLLVSLGARRRRSIDTR